MSGVVWRGLPSPGSAALLWIPPCSRMGEEEQETPQTPSPFHCFSLPRASTLEGNPTCGSQGKLRFVSRVSSHVDLGTTGGTFPIPPAAGQGGTPLLQHIPTGNSQTPKPVVPNLPGI